MKKKALKYLIMAITIFTACTQAIACPTCVGRLMLGIKKPFFELYRPRKIDKRRRKKTRSTRSSSLRKTTANRSRKTTTGTAKQGNRFKKRELLPQNYVTEQKSHELIRGKG